MTPDERDEPVGVLNGSQWSPPKAPPGEQRAGTRLSAPLRVRLRGLLSGVGSTGPIETAAGSPLPAIALAPSSGSYHKWGKRTLDIAATAVASVLLLPIVFVIAIAIRLDTRGPILYRSWRVGEGGRLFRFLKFRSMVVGADAIRDHLLHLNEADGPVFKIARDPRITKVGHFLRRTSLDELPQLWNVLIGDMSLVGPRPPIPNEVRLYEPWQLRRLSVRPGLTCLWQISGRSSIGFDEWMRLDMEYIDHRSFQLDLKILLLTIPAVVSGKGAY